MTVSAGLVGRREPTAWRAMEAARPHRVLMTVDAVGGVWRYALDLGAALRGAGIEVLFVGLGPRPAARQILEAETVGRMEWLDAPLDWLTEAEQDLDVIPGLLAKLVLLHDIDLLHLNVPSQAVGLGLGIPVVTVSHSCVVTWFEAVRRHAVPPPWAWQQRRNRRGFDVADAVLAPSRSHAALLERCYGTIDGLDVVYNATAFSCPAGPKRDFVYASGRWWDDGKNGALLDRAAALVDWPVVMAGPSRGPGGQVQPILNADDRGELPYAEAMAVMQQAAVVVSPSLYEPFGLAVLEAAAAGAALVLADNPTYRELWGGAALFFDPRDPQSLAQAIGALVADPNERDRLGRLAEARSRRFSVEAQRDATLAVYARALERFPVAAGAASS